MILLIISLLSQVFFIIYDWVLLFSSIHLYKMISGHKHKKYPSPNSNKFYSTMLHVVLLYSSTSLGSLWFTLLSSSCFTLLGSYSFIIHQHYWDHLHQNTFSISALFGSSGSTTLFGCGCNDRTTYTYFYCKVYYLYEQ